MHAIELEASGWLTRLVPNRLTLMSDIRHTPHRGAIAKTYHATLKLDPGNLGYFKAALKDEQAHLAAWKKALGPKNTLKGFKLAVPSKYVGRRSWRRTWAPSTSSTPTS